MDRIDRKILEVLQKNSQISLEELGDICGLSRNACWRRVKQLEADGVLKKQVALVDADLVGAPLKVVIFLRTPHHRMDWAETLARATRDMHEILAVYRMTGDLDYMIEARVADMAGYDDLYRRLISKMDLSDVSSSFVMQVIKETTAVPILR